MELNAEYLAAYVDMELNAAYEYLAAYVDMELNQNI